MHAPKSSVLFQVLGVYFTISLYGQEALPLVQFCSRHLSATFLGAESCEILPLINAVVPALEHDIRLAGQSSKESCSFGKLSSRRLPVLFFLGDDFVATFHAFVANENSWPSDQRTHVVLGFKAEPTIHFSLI